MSVVSLLKVLISDQLEVLPNTQVQSFQNEAGAVRQRQTEGARSLSERFYFRHILGASCNGSVAKPRSMLNIAIFNPWRRSLYSCRTPGKEPLLAGNRLSDLILEFVICQPLLESFIMRELVNNLL